MADTSLSSPEKGEELQGCFHCQLPIPEGTHFTLNIDGEQQSFCCPGCQAVAEMICSGGLDQFYGFRSEANVKPDIAAVDYQAYDRDSLQQDFVRDDGATKTAHLLLDGITCAACVWLIEKYILQLPAINRVSVNASTHQCTVTWEKDKQSLSQIMAALAGLGYKPQPYTRQQQQSHRQTQQRNYLLRLGIAGFAMMQVGLVAAALYAGDIQGMDSQMQHLLRWVSLIVATPVVFFGAQPFWSAAWRHLRRGNLVMDVPVSLAIFLAYFASIWATITNTGEVYFDSIAMFTFFLLLGRYLEMRLRFRNQHAMGVMTALLPTTVHRVEGDQVVVIPRQELTVGDRIRVGSGETIPCDGLVYEGSSAVSEALLTGESVPISKQKGDEVIAGTVNTESPLWIEVKVLGENMRLSTIERMVEDAQSVKPKIQLIADRIAGYFVAAVLIVATTVFAAWYYIDASQALWITLSILVVTCPCALSLATPAALTAATAALRQQGLLVIQPHVLETVTSIDKVVFDKTGTLTEGQPAVTSIELKSSDWTAKDVMTIARALEQGSNHPIAKAFETYADNKDVLPSVEQAAVVIGSGVEGMIAGVSYRLGKLDFAVSAPIDDKTKSGQWLALSANDELIASIGLADGLKDSTVPAIKELKATGHTVSLLSGDSQSAVKEVADILAIDFAAEQLPEQKLRYMQNQQQNHRVMMVGDGINDGPVLAAADVSVAVDSATDFARTQADCVLLTQDLTVLPKLFLLAAKTHQIIRQNLFWALGYNVVALPLAAMGFIPPYLAALGMSASSLIVVVNALRLYR